MAALIAYLRALPPHPETYRQANAAEAILNKPDPALTVGAISARWTGLPGQDRLEATLQGNVLNLELSGSDRDGSIRDRMTQKALIDALESGVAFDFESGDGSTNSKKHSAFDEHGREDRSGQSGKPPRVQTDFLRALRQFAHVIGVESLLRIGLPRAPWFYIEPPEDQFDEQQDPVYYQAWWLLAHMSGVLREPAIAPSESGITSALKNKVGGQSPDLEAKVGDPIDRNELGGLLGMVFASQNHEAAAALVMLLDTYLALPG